MSSVFSVGNLPTVFTTDHTDSADIFQIPNHPCSSVVSVVKNSESDSVSSVFSVGTLPTVLTKDYADSAGISLIPNHPSSSVTSVVKNSDSAFRGFRVFRGQSSDRFHHGSHGYDLDKNPGRLPQIHSPSTPYPWQKKPWSIPNLDTPLFTNPSHPRLKCLVQSPILMLHRLPRLLVPSKGAAACRVRPP